MFHAHSSKSKRRRHWLPSVLTDTGDVLRDTSGCLPFGSLAWPRTNPRAKEFGTTALAFIVDAMKNGEAAFVLPLHHFPPFYEKYDCLLMSSVVE